MDITFTATTSKSGSLLVGSSSCARGWPCQAAWVAGGLLHALYGKLCITALLPARTHMPWCREFAGFDSDAPEAVVQAIMQVGGWVGCGDCGMAGSQLQWLRWCAALLECRSAKVVCKSQELFVLPPDTRSGRSTSCPALPPCSVPTSTCAAGPGPMPPPALPSSIPCPERREWW